MVRILWGFFEDIRGHEYVSMRVHGARGDENMFRTRTVCRTVILCMSLESDTYITSHTDFEKVRKAANPNRQLHSGFDSTADCGQN
jgi:hypothetical protein